MFNVNRGKYIKMKITESQLIRKIRYWAKKFGINKLHICTDNKTRYQGYVMEISGEPYFYFNINVVNKSKKGFTEAFIFHELGHILYKTYWYDKREKINRIKSEYLAEKFAYEMIEKYFPNKLKRVISVTLKYIYNNKWQKKYPIHTIAFTKLYLEKTRHRDAIIYSGYSF